jgi:hypothetical protein
MKSFILALVAMLFTTIAYASPPLPTPRPAFLPLPQVRPPHTLRVAWTHRRKACYTRAEWELGIMLWHEDDMQRYFVTEDHVSQLAFIADGICLMIAYPDRTGTMYYSIGHAVHDRIKAASARFHANSWRVMAAMYDANVRDLSYPSRLPQW